MIKKHTIMILPILCFGVLLFILCPHQAQGTNREFEFEYIRLFEGGYYSPEESQRNYIYSFPKSTTRYIWCRVAVKNLKYKIAEHQHKVEWLYYDTEGSLWGEIEEDFIINPEWEYDWIEQGWGWDEPGYWPGGTYYVYIFIDGQEAGQVEFNVYNDIPQLEFEYLKFFESGYTAPDESKRNYTTEFHKSTTRYIYFTIGVKNLLWDIESQRPQISGRYYGPDGSYLTEVDVMIDMPPEWDYADIWNGWGWGEPGNWEAGKYRVEILFGDRKVAEQHFTIYDDVVTQKIEGSLLTAPDVDTSYVDDILNKGVDHLDRGEFDDAIQAFSRVIALTPDDSDAYYNRGLTYYYKGDYDRAVSDYTKVIEINPLDADAFINRGLIYYYRGDYDKAIDDYSNTIEINPGYSDAYFNRGLAYSEKGEYEKAIYEYTKVIEIDPNDSEAYNNRGLIHYNREEYEKAISDFSKALSIDSMYANAFNNRGIVYYDTGNYGRAIDDYTKAIEIESGNSDVYYNRGLAYYDEGEYDRAIADYTKAIEINPNDTEIYYNLGLAYDKKSKSEKASYDESIGIEKPEKEKLPPKTKHLLKEEAFKRKGDYLKFTDIIFDTVFPVLFKYYDEYPVGRAVLYNSSDSPVNNIKVSLFVKRYMDSPKRCEAPDQLYADKATTINLYALFTDSVLDITEGTKVAADVILTYTYKDNEYSSTVVKTIDIYDRNATVWDDNRKTAAFVTSRDPAVLKLSKFIAGAIQDKGSTAIDKNLRMAMAVYETLSLYGMSYVVDPVSPYSEFSQKKEAVDFLQFPRQSLEYKAGDCDDLSIMYNAMLESLGIETAFITTPGHIFSAFSIGMNPQEARKTFWKTDELIFMNKKAWIPVEVTQINEGFLNAWHAGATQWREAVAKKKEGFYPVHDSWKLYEPVGLPAERVELSLPSRESVISNYLQEVAAFIDREVNSRVASLQTEINRSGGSPKFINKLGVLYARYGLFNKAEREFQRILAKNETYIPALLNMGHIHYLKKDTDSALEYYEQAYKKSPNNPHTLLSMARVNHELENYDIVKKLYERLKATDQELASQYAYLVLQGEEAVRATKTDELEQVVIWAED
ncbi:MAG: tetratricopeptide repeat protein [Spirochaetota bacterium]|nr:MAG: tetratricopeptide repeat protein [Spirochaetota bacterium]